MTRKPIKKDIIVNVPSGVRFTMRARNPRIAPRDIVLNTNGVMLRMTAHNPTQPKDVVVNVFGSPLVTMMSHHPKVN